VTVLPTTITLAWLPARVGRGATRATAVDIIRTAADGAR
jgi:hypothetical protein